MHSIEPRSSQLPTFAEMVDEVVPVIGVILVAGPPVIFVAGPWLLLGLMLSGPFAVLVGFVAAGIAAVVLAAVLAGLLATPYLLLRGLQRRHGTSHPAADADALVAHFDSRRVVA